MKGDREYDKNGNQKPLELGSDMAPTRPRIQAMFENVKIFVDNPDIQMGVGVRPRSELVSYIKKTLVTTT